MRSNKNKGFTLIELLAVILILGIIVSINIYSVINIIDDTKMKSYKVTINNIQKEASNYILEEINASKWIPYDGSSEYQCVSVENLIDAGYFKNDVLKSYVDKDRKVVKKDNVWVRRDTTSKAITENILMYRLGTEGYCDDFNTNGRITFISDDEWARSKNINIKYNIYNFDYLSNYIYEYSYLEDGSDEYSNINTNVFNRYEEKADINVNKNGMLYASIKDNNEYTYVSETFIVNKIDNDGPSIVFVNDGNTGWDKKVNSEINVNDSGIGTDDSSLKYIFTTDSSVDPNTSFVNKNIVSQNSGNGNYYLIASACDKLGNCNKKISNVFKLDNTVPVIDYDTNGNSVWSKNASSKVSVTDIHSGVDNNSLKYVYSSTNNVTPNQKFNNKKIVSVGNVTGNYYLITKACDMAGNCVIKTSNVFKLDNTKPVIKLETNNNEWLNHSRGKITVSDADSGIDNDKLKYIFSTNSDAVPNELFTNNQVVSDEKANVYLIVNACDMAGNCITQNTDDFMVDNLAPSARITSTNNVASSQTVTLTMSDEGSGVAAYYFGKENPNEQDVFWLEVNRSNKEMTYNNLVSESGKYYLGVKDALGNISVTDEEFYKTSLIIDDKNANMNLKTIITMVGNSFSVPRPTMLNNYTFGGWYGNSSYMGTVIENYQPNGDTNLYAKIDRPAYNVKIKYHVNGGAVKASTGSNNKWTTNNGIIYLNGKELITIVPYNATLDEDGLYNSNNASHLVVERPGYHSSSYNEWICLEGGCEGNTFDENDIYDATVFCDASEADCEVILGVNWEGNVYEINYIANGGYGTKAINNSKYCDNKYSVGGNHDISGTMTTQLCRYGEKCTLDKNLFVKKCHKFIGWTTDAYKGYSPIRDDKNWNLNYVLYGDGLTFTYELTEDLTLYAVWKDNHNWEGMGITPALWGSYSKFTCSHGQHDRGLVVYCTECQMSVLHYNKCYMSDKYNEYAGKAHCPCTPAFQKVFNDEKFSFSFNGKTISTFSYDNMRKFGGKIEGHSLTVLNNSQARKYCVCNSSSGTCALQ